MNYCITFTSKPSEILKANQINDISLNIAVSSLSCVAMKFVDDDDDGDDLLCEVCSKCPPLVDTSRLRTSLTALSMAFFGKSDQTS